MKTAFAAGVKREDIFVTTKLWATYSSRAEEALDKSLKSLGLDYVDLYLVHWPLAMNPNGVLTPPFVHTQSNSAQETMTDSPNTPTALAISSKTGPTFRHGN